MRGATGATGVGVSAVEDEYYLSTSPDEATGGTWQTEIPNYEDGKYLWIRQKITYTSGSVTYSAGVHDAQLDNAFARLSTAEGDLLVQNANIGNMSITLQAQDGQISNVSGRLNIAEGNIGTMSTSIGTLSNQVQTATNQMSGLAGRIGASETSIASLNSLTGGLSTDLDATSSALSALQTQFTNYQAEQGRYVHINPDGYLELGATGSNFKTTIDNQKLAFMDGATETAFISGQLFQMNNAIVNIALRIGKYEIQPKADGSVYWVWRG